MTSLAPAAPWSDLLREGRALAFLMLCLGIWLNAVDTLVTATIMPSVARELGGYAFFAWATAGYLLGSILAGAGAGVLGERVGVRRALAISALVYAAGCMASAVAASIWWFLLGRLVQGAGAGLLVGLCYVAVRRGFPERLWPSVFAVLSGVWGVATLLGPLVGGIFAGAHLWRVVFWLFAGQAGLFALVARRLPVSASGEGRAAALPLSQLALAAAAMTPVAAAATARRADVALAALGLGLVLFALLARVDRRAPQRLLPRAATDLRSAVAQGYAAVLGLSAAAIVFSVYGAAILQARLGLAPLPSGYAVASESLGWTVAALFAARAPAAAQGWFIRSGALAAALGLAACAPALARGGVAAVILAGGTMGGGFGLCWSFIAQRILRGLPPREEATGSAAIPLMQMLGNALGAAAAGVIANLCGLRDGLDAATAGRAAPVLVGAFVPVALLGAAAAWRLGGADAAAPPSAAD